MRIKDESPSEIAEVALVTIHEYAWYGGEEEGRSESCSLPTRQNITMDQYKIEVDPISMWILDSGFASHLRFSKTHMTHLVQWNAPITLDNRQHIYI
jgi:hypothetical protein